MAARILSNAEFSDAVERDYAAGLSFSQIAYRTGRSRSAVAGKAYRLGLTGRGAGRPSGFASAQSVALGARIRELHAEGLTTTRIGVILGVEGGAVRRRLHLAGLALNRPKPSTSRTRPTPPDRTPTSPARALVYRAGPVDLTPPPETSGWFADPKGCSFSCWETTERDPLAKRCCGAHATRGAYCDYHAEVVYAPSAKKAA